MNEAATDGDVSARQRRAADPVASVWVAASAGSGKTKVLTDRVLRLLLAGGTPDRLLCLTFTRAAAAEMAARIARRLAAWATADDAALDRHLAELLGRAADADERARARRLFFVALDAPGGLKIQTIHGFCQSLLARFPLEAGTAPDFRVLTERDSRQLLRDAVLATVRVAERDGGPLAAAFAAVTWRLTEADLLAAIHDLVRQQDRIAAFIDGHGGLDGAQAAVRARLDLEPGEDEASIVADAAADGAFDAAALRAAAGALAAGSVTDQPRGARIAAWLACADRIAGFDDYADAFIKSESGKPPAIRARLITKDAAKRVPGAQAALETEAARIHKVAMRRRDARLAETTCALLRIGGHVIAALRAMKAARGFVDFDDMIATARHLLRDEAAGAWVHFKLDGGLDHLLMDEAQDTSRQQWDIVRALAAEFFAGEGARPVSRTVFAVGDIKQSIFSFQGAEPKLFLASRDRFAAASRAALKPWHDVELPTSFRSTAAVLAAVDAVFAQSPAKDGVALDGRPIRHEVAPNRQGAGGSVEVWPPLVTAAAGDDDDGGSEEAPQLRMARLVADRIETMIGGEMLPARGRPIGAGDIMVLVRRRTAFVEALVRELKDRRVPVAGVDRMTLMEQLAVMDLLAIARFVLLPEDDLTLAVVLKGPLIGLDDEALFRIAHGRDGSLWRALGQAAEGDPALAAARQVLATWLARADQVTPFAFFSEVLAAGDGRRRWLTRLGPEADEPIAEFLHLALEYETLHPPSLQGFVAWMDLGREIEIKRDLEQAPGAVRIITVHSAKGLQAPVVILPDTLQVPKKKPRLVWLGGDGEPALPLWAPRSEDQGAAFVGGLEPAVQALREEYRRLLYVAMTRAEDRLIVCGWRDRRVNTDPDECWYRLIQAGLAAVATGDAMALETIDDPLLKASGAFPDGAEVLTLRCPQTAAPRREEAAGQGAVPDLPNWVRQAAPAEPLPPRPLAPSRSESEPPVRPPLAAGGGNGLKRGRLIHRLLQFLPSLPPAERAAAAARWLGQPVHRLAPAEQAELLAETLAVIATPAAAPLFGPDSLAEVPLAGEVGGRLIAGQVDRLIVTADRVIILDYKTDRPPPLREEDVPAPYIRQLAVYRAALMRIYPDRPVDCLLLWTCGPRLMALDGRRLGAVGP